MFTKLQYLILHGNDLSAAAIKQPTPLPDAWAGGVKRGFPQLKELVLYPGNEYICSVPDSDGQFRDVNLGARPREGGGAGWRGRGGGAQYTAGCSGAGATLGPGGAAARGVRAAGLQGAKRSAVQCTYGPASLPARCALPLAESSFKVLDTNDGLYDSVNNVAICPTDWTNDNQVRAAGG